jgi:hypothetical protein
VKSFATRVLVAIFWYSLASLTPGAVRAEPRLFPTLAPFQFMVGSWRCKSWMAATDRNLPRIDSITARYSVMSGGSALGQHVTGPDYRTFELFGYEASSKRIVASTYSDDGTQALASSRGWAGNAITLSGKVGRGGAGTDLRDILLKFTDRRFTHTTEIRELGLWKTVANSDCTKR